MKVALIFSTHGPADEYAMLPFASAEFVDSLVRVGLDPLVIRVIADAPGDAAEIGWGDSGPRALPIRRVRLATFLAAETPDAISTFGPEHHLAGIWPLAAANAPLVHCVSSWPCEETRAAPAIPALASIGAARVKRASRHVDAVVGTGRATIARFLTGGYFANAAFSAVVPPPVGRAAGTAAAGPPATRRSVPVFGVYAPAGPPALFSFISHAVDLTGRPDAIAVRIATHRPPASAAAGISTLRRATLEVSWRRSTCSPCRPMTMSWWGFDRGFAGGQTVIVPDRGGGAELIEYGRHGLMFCAGSAYHLADAINLIRQGWGEKPVLFATGGPPLRGATERGGGELGDGLGMGRGGAWSKRRASRAREPHEGADEGAMMRSALRYGHGGMAKHRSATCRDDPAIGCTAVGRPDAVASLFRLLREHQSAGVGSGAGGMPLRVVTSESIDALPLSEVFARWRRG